MSLPQARRLFARLMEKSQKEKLSSTERKLLIQARQVLRAEKKGKRNPMSKWIKFRDLPVGAKFIFSGEIEFPYSGIARGPWIKTGSRTYQHASGSYGPLGENLTFKVGSINAQTRLVNGSNPKWFPVTKRKAKRLGEAYRKAYHSFVRQKNPARETLIYGRVLKIYAQKTSGPYKGQRFVHTFKPGAIMVGMPDGSLRILHR